MKDVIFVVLLAIFIVLTYTALVALLAALLRGQTKRARQVVADSPVRTVIVGIIGWAVFGGLAAWLYSQAVVERLLDTQIVSGYFVAACAAVIVPSLICLLGAPGLYTHIGSRVATLRTREMSGETSELWCVVTGSLASLTAALFPFVGWFLIMPLLLAAEFGAGFRSFFR